MPLSYSGFSTQLPTFDQSNPWVQAVQSVQQMRAQNLANQKANIGLKYEAPTMQQQLDQMKLSNQRSSSTLPYAGPQAKAAASLTQQQADQYKNVIAAKLAAAHAASENQHQKDYEAYQNAPLGSDEKKFYGAILNIAMSPKPGQKVMGPDGNVLLSQGGSPGGLTGPFNSFGSTGQTTSIPHPSEPLNNTVNGAPQSVNTNQGIGIPFKNLPPSTPSSQGTSIVPQIFTSGRGSRGTTYDVTNNGQDVSHQSPTTSTSTSMQTREQAQNEAKVLGEPVSASLSKYQGPLSTFTLLSDLMHYKNNPAIRNKIVNLAVGYKLEKDAIANQLREASPTAQVGQKIIDEQVHQMYGGLPNDHLLQNLPNDIQQEASLKAQQILSKGVDISTKSVRTAFPVNKSGVIKSNSPTINNKPSKVSDPLGIR